MDNLAIVIGISEYENESNLSACSNDADIIYSILESTEKYKEILFLKGTVESSFLKEKLIEFSKKYEKEEIEELFFYFSGHGYSNESDFYFCTTDIQTARINSTSLQNTELDTLIRKIEPKLYVKVVDACFSGTHYIKGTDFETVFQKSIKQKAFENVYFFYSSHSDQTSKATSEISTFTKSFVSCIKESKLFKSLRYKAIIDFITDFFEENEKQKPYFVIQGDMTETFCTITEKTMQSINKEKAKHKKEEENDSFKKIKTLLQQHATKEEMKQVSEKIQEIFEEFKPDNPIILDYYDISKTSNSFVEPEIIGKWVKENNKSCHLFAVDVIDKHFNICGFKDTINDLCNGKLIELTPLKHFIPQFTMETAYLYSFSTIYILYRFYIYLPISWDNFKDPISLNELSVCEIPITKFDDSEIKKVYTILEEFEEYILESLEKYHS